MVFFSFLTKRFIEHMRLEKNIQIRKLILFIILIND